MVPLASPWSTPPLSVPLNRYYEDGAFGIRVENLVVIEQADTQHRWVE